MYHMRICRVHATPGMCTSACMAGVDGDMVCMCTGCHLLYVWHAGSDTTWIHTAWHCEWWGAAVHGMCMVLRVMRCGNTLTCISYAWYDMCMILTCISCAWYSTLYDMCMVCAWYSALHGMCMACAWYGMCMVCAWYDMCMIRAWYGRWVLRFDPVLQATQLHCHHKVCTCTCTVSFSFITVSFSFTPSTRYMDSLHKYCTSVAPIHRHPSLVVDMVYSYRCVHTCNIWFLVAGRVAFEIRLLLQGHHHM